MWPKSSCLDGMCGATDCPRCFPGGWQLPTLYEISDRTGIRHLTVYDDCVEVYAPPSGRVFTIDRQTAAGALRWARRVGKVERIG